MDDKEFTPKDFVYLGVRVHKTTRQITIQIIDNDSLGSQLFFPYSAKEDRTVGGVYSGAEFSETSVRGLNIVGFKGMWKDRTDILSWQSSHNASVKKFKKIAMEKKLKNSPAIESELLTLQKHYHDMRERGDWVGASCFLMYVQDTITKKPKL